MKFITFILIFILLFGFNCPSFSAVNSSSQIGLKSAGQWQEETNFQNRPSGHEVTNCFPESKWWLQFNDAILNDYMEEAIRCNKDIRYAIARVEESQALARYTMGKEFPQLTLYGLFARVKNSQNFLAPLVGAPAQGGAQPNRSTNVYIVPLVAQYQLDYLLINRSRTRAAEKEVKATQFDYETVLINLTSEVATAYLNLIRSDKLLQLNNKLLCYLEKSLELRCSLFNEGEISYDDVLANQLAISQIKTTIAEIEKVQGLAVHQLCILMGKPPVEQSCFPRTDFDLLCFNSEIKLGDPCDLVSKRPDILATEARLQEAGINVSIARREFFPTLNITGVFGFASSKLNNLFDWRSNLAAIAANAGLQLFTGGSKIANLKVNKARYKAALEQYQKTILTAFQEVEDSIKRLNSDFSEYNEANKQVFDAQCLSNLTNSRYIAGEDSVLDVITTQQRLINNEQTQVQSKSTLLIDNIGLYRALGGGF